MEILIEGDLELLKQPKIFKCDKCGCVFKATKDEYCTSSQYNETYYYCECPTCCDRVYLGIKAWRLCTVKEKMDD